MTRYIFALLIGIVFTVLIEVLVARHFGFKTKNEMKVIALASIITYPILNMLIYLFDTLFLYDYQSFFYYFVVTILEIIVVFVEYKIIKYVYSNRYSSKKIFLTSLSMNSASYIFGLIVLSQLFKVLLRIVL